MGGIYGWQEYQSRDWCVVYREYVMVKRLETLRVMAAYWSRAPTEQQWEVYMHDKSTNQETGV